MRERRNRRGEEDRHMEMRGEERREEKRRGLERRVDGDKSDRGAPVTRAVLQTGLCDAPSSLREVRVCVSLFMCVYVCLCVCVCVSVCETERARSRLNNLPI